MVFIGISASCCLMIAIVSPLAPLSASAPCVSASHALRRAEGVSCFCPPYRPHYENREPERQNPPNPPIPTHRSVLQFYHHHYQQDQRRGTRYGVSVFHVSV